MQKIKGESSESESDKGTSPLTKTNSSKFLTKNIPKNVEILSSEPAKQP